MTSSSGFAPSVATRPCAALSSSGTSPSRVPPIQCCPATASYRKRASIAAGPLTAAGPAPFPPSRTSLRMPVEIAPRTGTAFELRKGQRLRVIDPQGEQVSDLLAFNAADTAEVISSGRTFDYASKIYLSVGDQLYSNRSNVMLRILEDTVGRHDFLLTPCSKDTFRIIYGDADPHRGCFGNLAEALAPYGIGPDQIPTAFNVFMNVVIDGVTGELAVL